MASPRYALIVHRFQPFCDRHLEQVKAAMERGLRPVIVVRSQNNSEHPSYDPVKTPLTLEQQIEDIKQALPADAHAVIIPIADLDNQQQWAEALLARLDDTAFLKQCGLESEEGIRKETVLLTHPEQLMTESGEARPSQQPAAVTH